jgi:hypothetical protein
MRCAIAEAHVNSRGSYQRMAQARRPRPPPGRVNSRNLGAHSSLAAPDIGRFLYPPSESESSHLDSEFTCHFLPRDRVARRKTSMKRSQEKGARACPLLQSFMDRCSCRGSSSCPGSAHRSNDSWRENTCGHRFSRITIATCPRIIRSASARPQVPPRASRTSDGRRRTNSIRPADVIVWIG